MTKKVETELTKLKAKCLKKDGSPRKDATGKDLARLKQLQDAEPLTKAELEEAQKRNAAQKQKDIDDYKARQEAKIKVAAQEAVSQALGRPVPDPTLMTSVSQPDDPRITELKDALRVFTQLEADPSRPDEFILIQRGVAITAGDVRNARKAMKI